MNKIYKVIWNASLGIWVAVSEIAKGKTKNCSGVASSTNELIVGDGTSESKYFEYKVLVLAILGVITPSVFAGYEAGGGSTFTNCTSTSAGSGSRSAGSVAIGTSSTATIPTSGQACAPTKDSIAIGLSASTAGAAGNNQSIAIGRESAASGDQAIALGANVKASGNSSVAIGGDDVDKVVDSDGALYTTITGGTIVKNNYIPTESSGAASTAMGVQAKASGAFSTALGMTSAASGAATVALGVKSTATGDGALAIGAVSNAQDDGTIAIGINSKAVGDNSISIGSGSTSTTGANTTGPNATSIGSNASSVADATAIGSGAKANVSGGVAIGKDSVANTAAGVAGFDPVTGTTSTQTTNVWKSTQGAIALGDAANNVTRQLTGLAAGTNDSDAVNVAQLKTVTNQTFKLQANGDVASAVKTSDTVQFLDGKNINITRSGNNITVQTVDTPTFTSVTTGNSKLDNSGLNITGGPSVTTAGINAGNQKITNVKAGTNATDAVNFSQLNATNQNVTTAQNTANTALTNAAAAQATADKGLNFSVNGGTTDNVKLGETVNFADGTNTTAEYDPATNTYKYSVNDNIALTNAGSLTVGNTKVDDSGLTITGGPSVTTAGINAANQKITNVAAGTISSTSTDAVNGSQLNATNQNVTTAQNTANTAVTNAAAAQNTANTAVTNAAAAQATADKGLNFIVNGGTADNVKLGETVNFANGTNTTATYDPATNTYKYSVNDNIALTNAGSLTVGNTKVDNSGLTITGGPSVTTAGINAGNQKITNVKAGTNATDAVNFSQLNATNQNVTTAQNTANTALTNAAAAQAMADKGLNFSVNGGTTDNVKLGETVNFADGTNTTVEYDPATNTYKYNVNDNIALTNAGSLTVGNSKVDNSGLTITGGPSVTTAGINAANQKITNVAAGTNATDAVNVSQLGAVTTAANSKTDALGTSTASNLGGGAVYNPVTGAVSSPVYSVNGNNVNNVGDAITALDKGWTLQSNGANAGAVKAGDTVDIGTVAGESNLKVTKTGNKIQYGLNRDLNIDSVTAGDSKLDTNGLTIAGGPSVTTAGIDAANQKVTNVAAGTISSTSTDAVNGSQLNATNQNVTTAQNTANTAVSNAAAAQATADKGLNFSVNGGTADNVKLGETVNFADGSNTTAVYDPATNTYKYNVNDNIALTNAGSLTVGNSKVDNSGLTITGGPSVTTAGINAGNQKITNVAAGTISATSTDAVNGSQLNATNQNITTAQNTANTAVSNAAAAQATADKGLNFSVNGGTADNVKLGETVNFADGTNTTAVYDPATNTYKYNVNDNIALTNAGSLTVGNSKVDNSGLTITGGPSVTTAGINAANQKITNVAAGTNATDAVNVSQLGAVTTAANSKTDALGISTASNLGGGAVYNPVTGAVSSPVYSVNGNNVNNVGDAITALDKGWTLQSNGANPAAVKAGDTVDIGTVAGESNLKVTKTGNKIQYGLNRDLNVDSVTAGDSKLDTNGLTIAGGPSVTTAGIDAANQKITNVAAGTISASSTDAVNGSQLNATNQNVTTAQNTANTALTNAVAAQAMADKGLNFSVNGGTADNVKIGETVNFADGTNTTAVYDPATNTYKYNVNDNIVLTNAGSLTVGNTKVDNSGLTITGGPSVTTAGINAGNQKITNVTAGANATDAVNVSQLNATNQNVTTAQNTANTAMTNAAAAQATADKGLNFSVNGGTAKNVKLGETVNFADGTNTTAVYDPATNTYKYSVNDNIALTNAGSLTVGNTKVDNSGLTITGGPSVTTAGINAGNQKITNVAAGTNPTDAVNISQLGAVTTAANTKTDALGTSTASNLGGGAVYNPVTGAVSSPVYSVNGNNVNNVGDAIIALDKGWTLQSNGANAGAVKAGDTVDIGTVAGETNLKVTKTGNKIQYGLNRDLNIDSVTAGDSKLDTNGLTIAGGPSVTKSGINAANQKVTNVAAGTISSTSTDAVNGSQLNATNQNVTTAQNTANTAVTNAAAAQATADKGLNFSVNGGTAKNVKLGETVNFADGTNTTAVYDLATNTYKYNVNDNIALTNAGSLTVGNTKVDNSGLTITGGPSVTAAGIDAGNQKITNVAAGTNATDAVNVSQLGAVTTAANTKTDALGTSTASNLGGGAVYNPVTGAVSSPVYSVNGNNVNNVGDAITALDKGWTLQSNGANAGAVKAGDTVDIGTVAGETNLKVTKTGNKIQYGLNRDLNIDSVTAGDSKLDTNGLTIAGGPSVTKSGINAANQKVTNVAAGTISSTSTDAVNGSQLHTLDSRVTKNGDSTANIFGGGAKANPDGSITNPTYNVAGTSANNVGDALTALDKAVTDAGTAANAGWTVSANGDAATAKKIKPNGKVNFTGDDNLTVAQSSETDNEGNIKVALNKNLKVDSVTAGNTIIDTTGVKVGNNVQLGSTGLIIAGGPSITTSGINAGNKVITNVAAGVNTTDAVNKGQLDSAITNINNNVGALANSAVQYDKNADGTVNKDSVTFAGGANGTALKNVANGTVAAGSKDAVNGGQLWNVQQQVDKNTGDISNLKNDINNGKTGLVQQTDKDAAITVGKDTGGTQVNVAGKAGDRTVTGVKAGTVTSTSTDAVNGSQLNRTNQALVSALGGGAGYNNITESFSNPTYNVGDQSYNNVGDAIGALNQADQTLNNKIDNVNNKLEQAFYATNQRIDNLEEKMSAGIAANAALENAPFIAGKVTMAVGAAYYNQQNAVGVTLRKTADNGRWSLTTGAALGSQGSPLVRVGVSTVID